MDTKSWGVPRRKQGTCSHLLTHTLPHPLRGTELDPGGQEGKWICPYRLWRGDRPQHHHQPETCPGRTPEPTSPQARPHPS